MKPIQIKTLAELIRATEDRKPHHFLIQLKYELTSRKTIRRSGGVFYVHNHIDDTDQELTTDEIMEDSLTNIGKAMKKGAFWMV